MLEIDKIYQVDCLDGMSKIDDKSVSLILTDPPYEFQGIPIMQSPLLLVKILIDSAYLSTLETGINRKHLI